MDFANLEPALAAAQDYVAARAPRGYYAETYRGGEDLYLPGVAALLRVLPPTRVLDVGPGWGTMAVLLRSWGWEVDVVDCMPVGTFITEALLLETGIRYHHCALETDLVLPSLAADLVLLTMVCGHLRYRPDHALRRVAHWLAPGGVLVCSNIDKRRQPVPCAYADWRQMPLLGDPRGTVTDLVTCMMDEAEYRELLTGCFAEATVWADPVTPILYGICRGALP